MLRLRSSLRQSLGFRRGYGKWSGLTGSGHAPQDGPGYTLIELMVVLVILATLASMAVPTYSAYINKARVVQAISDIEAISLVISDYKRESGECPTTLDDVGYGNLRDPWGYPYQYLNIATAKGNGKLRKDHFLVPINSDYDLYSMGQDGESVSPLTAKPSRDDIVRANDGGYIGLASLY